ncbi:MAG TPA: hypothetical protein VFN35_22565 [Ktedonobacteraceae bacterium]|nr:hypothetical protein [Ktedonobacteraceae bacterium]
MSYSAVKKSVYLVVLSTIVALLLTISIATSASAASIKATQETTRATSTSFASPHARHVWGCGWQWITDYSQSEGGYWFWKCQWYD